ncbi:unnamed protein product, partial [Ectocarpus fasciculatus]
PLLKSSPSPSASPPPPPERRLTSPATFASSALASAAVSSTAGPAALLRPSPASSSESGASPGMDVSRSIRSMRVTFTCSRSVSRAMPSRSPVFAADLASRRALTHGSSAASARKNPTAGCCDPERRWRPPPLPSVLPPRLEPSPAATDAPATPTVLGEGAIASAPVPAHEACRLNRPPESFPAPPSASAARKPGSAMTTSTSHA